MARVIVASTTGGFLTGVGLCMLLICFGGIKVMEPVSWEIQGARRRIGLIYRTTHSLTYWDVMSDLDTLAPKAKWLADNLGPAADDMSTSILNKTELYNASSAKRTTASTSASPSPSPKSWIPCEKRDGDYTENTTRNKSW